MALTAVKMTQQIVRIDKKWGKEEEEDHTLLHTCCRKLSEFIVVMLLRVSFCPNYLYMMQKHNL